MNDQTSGSSVNDKELMITMWHDYEATRDELFRAFIDRSRIAWWFGPNGFTTTIIGMDVRPGGVWNYVMHGPDGTDYPDKATYVEITEPERLVYDHAVDRPGAPRMFRQTVSFDTAAGKSRVTFELKFDSREEFERNLKAGAVEGGLQTLARLEEYLDKSRAMAARAAAPLPREMTLDRTFEAPRERVWAAWTDPKQLARWWGPRGFTNPVCEFDARPEGEINIVMRGPDGLDYPMEGEVREVAEPERLVFTATTLEDDAGVPQLETLDTVVLADLGGRTKLELRVFVDKLGPSALQARAGMEEGWSSSLDKLAEFLKKS